MRVSRLSSWNSSGCRDRLILDRQRSPRALTGNERVLNSDSGWQPANRSLAQQRAALADLIGPQWQVDRLVEHDPLTLPAQDELQEFLQRRVERFAGRF